jgi:hypothetical protein
MHTPADQILRVQGHHQYRLEPGSFADENGMSAQHGHRQQRGLRLSRSPGRRHEHLQKFVA